MEENRENVDDLPGVPLGENIAIAISQEDALRDADVVLFSAPAQHFRSALEGALPYIKDDALIINVAKGIEQKSLKRMSEIAADVLDMDRYVVLSVRLTQRKWEENCRPQWLQQAVISRRQKPSRIFL